MRENEAGSGAGGDAGLMRVRGARVHNLRDVDVDLPRDRLVVLTGVSGSGKSSLAFDTLYAEGQRRYIESLSVYARQFLDQLERPDVDLIEGLPPTVAIEQDVGAANPRSTVGTITEIHDYLRLLYARAGTPHCPECGEAIRSESAEQIVSGALDLPEGRKVIVLAPLVRGRKGQHSEAFDAIRRAGLIRARVDGEILDLPDPPPKLVKTKNHDIEAVVDRLVIREGIRPRLAESVDRALRLGDGAVILAVQDEAGGGWTDQLVSTRLACLRCGRSFTEFEPRSFSFNSPHGACPKCEGLGTVPAFDGSLLLPAEKQGLAPEYLGFWTALKKGQADALAVALRDFAKRHHLTARTPRSKWPEGTTTALLEGDGTFEGLIPYLENARATAKTDAQRAGLDAFREDQTCPDCQGTRLKPESRAVRVGGRSIVEVTGWPVQQAAEFLATLTFPDRLQRVGPPVVREVETRLAYLVRVGLGYLSLDRRADTLSGGEYQRVRLASVLGSGLIGTGFILDEPTAGLHPRDTDRLLESLRDLRDAGNTLVVVEHDEAVIRAADWVVDLGPGAGPDGGLIVAEGSPETLDGPHSLTARYLNRPPGTNGPTSAPSRTFERWITIEGPTEHNLKGDKVRFPVGGMTCFTGVSGSGKSTLVLDILARAAHRLLQGTGPRPGKYVRIEGLEAIDKVVVVDQSPIGRTPRSTPATYTGVFDQIRQVFAKTREAKVRGFKVSRFSFNVKGGRCEACQGQGLRRIAMQFLPDLFVRCEECAGKRFNRATLEATYKGRSIGDVLEMRVDEALVYFDNVPQVHKGLEALHEAGLGYLTLGQPSTTLSGGESQRVKLAAELGRPATSRTLFVLDEPTTGLHFADVDNLLRVLKRLAGLGNTLAVIEHQLDVIRSADWVVDLGPGGGEAGGSVVAIGRPEAIRESEASATGRYL